MSSVHRACKCGAVYDRSEHIVEQREISSFECAVCGATIENWKLGLGSTISVYRPSNRDREQLTIPSAHKTASVRRHLMPLETSRRVRFHLQRAVTVFKPQKPLRSRVLVLQQALWP